MEINNKNLEEFLKEIGFSNNCCGCSNKSYEIEKSFYVYNAEQEKKIIEDIELQIKADQTFQEYLRDKNDT